MNPSTLVDSSTFSHDNEFVLFEDLMINMSTCGLYDFKASLWDELVHFVDLIINSSTCGLISKHPYGMNSSTCGLYNKLVHLWT